MQMTGQIRSALLACVTILCSWPAHAQDATLVLSMAGEAYEGAPKFRLVADKAVIGTGELAKAVDTAKGERLKSGKDLNPTGTERFLFSVPNIQNVSQFEIEFTNDAWAGKNKPGDRNLYVLGLTLSVMKKTATGAVAEIRDFPPAQLKAITRNPDGAHVTRRYSALFQEGRLRLTKPEGGWLTSASTHSAAQSTAPQSAAKTPCRQARLELKGYEKNTVALSPPMREQLEKAGKTLRGTSCSALVTAYASGGPSDTFRAKLSLARADAVARELAKLGMAPELIKTESGKGGGRRVIISFE